ncbi:hypothetical protein P7K49_019139 [Saguinus oedipus]|uniref:Uncharacterized protein n=1 Tax=Saguinus oedipus TaxID=9490 RepID=A0ABQ9UWM8_SAGOE|nr:hypothetical protein P7K49_019139 [Saguinus oedipus]
MPNSRSVYNFVKLEIGKAPRDTGGSSGSRAASPHPRPPPPRCPKPRFCGPELGNPLPGQQAWRRGGAASAESPRGNAAGRLCSALAGAPAATTASIRDAPGKLAALVRSSDAPLSWTIALRSSNGENVHFLPPFSLVASNLETPSSLQCREFRRMRGGKAKYHPLPKLRGK